jgi:hypothetical protein
MKIVTIQYKDVFNVSSDNKIGILSLNSDFSDPIINTLPYVIFKRNIADPSVTSEHFLTIKKVAHEVPRRSNK